MPYLRPSATTLPASQSSSRRLPASRSFAIEAFIVGAFPPDFPAELDRSVAAFALVLVERRLGSDRACGKREQQRTSTSPLCRTKYSLKLSSAGSFPIRRVP